MASFEPKLEKPPGVVPLKTSKMHGKARPKINARIKTVEATSTGIPFRHDELMDQLKGKPKRKPSALTEIEELMQRRGSGSNAVPTTTHGDSKQWQMPAGIDHKAERRAFMSHRADKIHSKPVMQASSSGKTGGLDTEIDASLLSPEEFRTLQLEVEKLGGAALDKKQKKVWQAAYLARIGAKAEKLPRMSAKIGGGIAKKRLEREERDRAAKIESGEVRTKGQAAKRKREKSENYDRGLQEAGPGFKNGVLRIKKLS